MTDKSETPNQPGETPAAFVIPPAIEKVIQDFDRAGEPFTALDVSQALGPARRELQDPPKEHDYGAWTEILAFALVPERDGSSPWRTYFAPIASGADKDGNPFYSP